MVFNAINIHCDVISVVKVNGNKTDILYTFNLIEPPCYMMNIIPNNILYQNVTKEKKNIQSFIIEMIKEDQLTLMVMY